jgi:molybdenum cofactor synthesis domain-containing protein
MPSGGSAAGRASLPDAPAGRAASGYPRAVGAGILTIGNEIVSGDVPNTNATWLAQRLGRIGIHVDLVAAVPDRIDVVVDLVRREAPRVDELVVTGGLGGTPDDITREALAAAFSVPQVEVPSLAAELRARFRSAPDYAARWALLPEGSRPLENPLGGAPGFAIANVYVLPGLPSEMEAMFGLIEGELRRGPPIEAWRRTYRTTESVIVAVLEAMDAAHPGVLVGSYPRFDPRPEVDVVVKSSDASALATAVAWIEAALDDAVRRGASVE